jgi:HAD superfamily hydrolase (TIGR01509 family)
MIHAVIFDMDGVISNTHIPFSRAESALLREYGIEMRWEEVSRQFSGERARDWIPQLFQTRGIAAEDMEQVFHRRRELVEEQLAGGIQEIPGATALITLLTERHVPIAVASSSRRPFIDRVLAALKLTRYFPVIISADDVVHGKPHPEPYLKAAQGLGVSPEDCVVIEDGYSGMQSAKAAGMRCIGLVAHPDGREYPADVVIPTLVDLTPERLMSV